MTAAATLAVDSRCILGEGILWHEQDSALLWVDIEASRLWMHSPHDGRTHYWTVHEKPGCLALGVDGRLLLGLANGLHVADLDAATADALPLRHLVDVERDSTDTRINDGRADRQGNFVFGTKSERVDQAAIGSFYQYSAQHGLRRLALPQVAIPNSICFSVDGATLYYCDSLQPRILCCDYDADSAGVSNLRTFVEVDHADASPDGSSIDTEGALWNAQWGASRVVRYRQDGSIDRIVELPVTQPSCCTIGGAGYDQLYVTSAREGLSVQELENTPYAGGVFQVQLPHRLGLPESRVRIP
ncbi:MAG TPA: SMP-30/gluconolactonase/LRE family protein [Pseudoxanthomonas sp.]|nr:SMP-30/gluconolactonase/LRE family protein [Pseudoxanthomonas sp.]